MEPNYSTAHDASASNSISHGQMTHGRGPRNQKRSSHGTHSNFYGIQRPGSSHHSKPRDNRTRRHPPAPLVQLYSYESPSTNLTIDASAAQRPNDPNLIPSPRRAAPPRPGLGFSVASPSCPPRLPRKSLGHRRPSSNARDPHDPWHLPVHTTWPPVSSGPPPRAAPSRRPPAPPAPARAAAPCRSVIRGRAALP